MIGRIKTKSNLTEKKIRLLLTILLCCLCFLSGIFVAYLLFLGTEDSSFWSLHNSWQLRRNEIEGIDLLARGATGDDFITSIPFQVLSWKPRALYFPKFATAEQCEAIIEMARPKLEPSMVALRLGDKESKPEGIRTSSGMFISASEDKTGILDAIEEKIARASLLPRSHGESFNIIHYDLGQRYNAHYDAFDPSEYGPQSSMRVASFLLYLSDVEAGGDTMFPLEDRRALEDNYDYIKCFGLRVKPRKGDGLLFFSLLPNSTIDSTSLHGSCPVTKGDKWVATKWIRDRENFVI